MLQKLADKVCAKQDRHSGNLLHQCQQNSKPITLYFKKIPGCVAQSVTCLTEDLGALSLIPVQTLTFAEIDHEIINQPLTSLPLIQEGCCQLYAKVCARSTG